MDLKDFKHWQLFRCENWNVFDIAFVVEKVDEMELEEIPIKYFLLLCVWELLKVLEFRWVDTIINLKD